MIYYYELKNYFKSYVVNEEMLQSIRSELDLQKEVKVDEKLSVVMRRSC